MEQIINMHSQNFTQLHKLFAHIQQPQHQQSLQLKHFTNATPDDNLHENSLLKQQPSQVNTEDLVHPSFDNRKASKRLGSVPSQGARSIFTSFASNKLIGRFRRAMLNKVMNALHEAEALKKSHAKDFENKKMLKAKVYKVIRRLQDERPLCAHHTKHQRDYQLKIDFVNSKNNRKITNASSQDAYAVNNTAQMSKSYQMLIASEKAKRGVDNLPKLQNLNAALYESFSEEELQIIFEDLRFFFPDEKIYKRLAIFHELDIFEGEHFKIKETYKRKIQALTKKREEGRKHHDPHNPHHHHHPLSEDEEDEDVLHFDRASTQDNQDLLIHDTEHNPFSQSKKRKIRIESDSQHNQSMNSSFQAHARATSQLNKVTKGILKEHSQFEMFDDPRSENTDTKIPIKSNNQDSRLPLIRDGMSQRDEQKELPYRFDKFSSRIPTQQRKLRINDLTNNSKSAALEKFSLRRAKNQSVARGQFNLNIDDKKRGDNKHRQRKGQQSEEKIDWYADDKDFFE
ncbi:hypothetical protein FGO68_gene5968 [Halteria grandinella]|uniref:Uncharacterized protein n=1 Tax=Halteria grandinella TaxID=5974 RepID=A0A8J8T219_HALGN|nr:hypothetical protein FGO68_gene5968 [Halteria grandinella]